MPIQAFNSVTDGLDSGTRDRGDEPGIFALCVMGHRRIFELSGFPEFFGGAPWATA